MAMSSPVEVSVKWHDLVRRKEIGYHPDLSPALLDRIRAACLASPVIEDEDKDCIR
jgi:hypothetical protein